MYVGFRNGYVKRYKLDEKTDNTEVLNDDMDKIPGIAVDEIGMSKIYYTDVYAILKVLVPIHS